MPVVGQGLFDCGISALRATKDVALVTVPHKLGNQVGVLFHLVQLTANIKKSGTRTTKRWQTTVLTEPFS